MWNNFLSPSFFKSDWSPEDKQLHSFPTLFLKILNAVLKNTDCNKKPQESGSVETSGSFLIKITKMLNHSRGRKWWSITDFSLSRVSPFYKCRNDWVWSRSPHKNFDIGFDMECCLLSKPCYRLSFTQNTEHYAYYWDCSVTFIITTTFLEFKVISVQVFFHILHLHSAFYTYFIALFKFQLCLQNENYKCRYTFKNMVTLTQMPK